jgi:hypothetical protein
MSHPFRAPRARTITLAVTAGIALAPATAHAMCTPDMPCPSGDKVAFVGTFADGGAKRLAVHAAPRTRSKVIRRVRAGGRALIVCQTRGSLAKGPYGRNRIWDKLLHGGYISDTKVYTGSDGRVAPPCTAPAPVPATGQDPFAYDDPGAWNNGRNCSGGYTKGAVALRGWLQRHYRFTSNIQGYACRQNTANPAQMSVHAEGRALDWMANAGVPAQRRAVNRFRARLAADNWRLARAMGIQELIWNRQIWTSYHHSEGWRAYTGPNPHTDHIHIGLNRAGASKRTSFYR